MTNIPFFNLFKITKILSCTLKGQNLFDVLPTIDPMVIFCFFICTLVIFHGVSATITAKAVLKTKAVVIFSNVLIKCNVISSLNFTFNTLNYRNIDKLNWVIRECRFDIEDGFLLYNKILNGFSMPAPEVNEVNIMLVKEITCFLRYYKNPGNISPYASSMELNLLANSLENALNVLIS